MSEPQIVHVPEQDRWEAVEGDGEARRAVGFLSYELAGGVRDMRSTEVDPSRRGHGLAGRLVEAVLQHAREQGLQVRPTCPFVPRYLDRHPEHQDLVVGSRRGSDVPAGAAEAEGDDG